VLNELFNAGESTVRRDEHSAGVQAADAVMLHRLITLGIVVEYRQRVDALTHTVSRAASQSNPIPSRYHEIRRIQRKSFVQGRSVNPGAGTEGAGPQKYAVERPLISMCPQSCCFY